MNAPSPRRSLGFLVWHLSLRWQASTTRALAPLGITATQYAVLASLHGLQADGQQPNQAQLAAASGLDPMHVSRLTRTFEHLGLVTRVPSFADPRALQLALTDAGIETVTAGMAIVRELESRRLRALGDSWEDDADRLHDVLGRLLDASDA